jgi:hypothetical protein
MVTILYTLKQNKLNKSIHITSRRGPLGCETSKFPHFLKNRLTDGGEIVSLTRRPLFTPGKIPGTYVLDTESTPGP